MSGMENLTFLPGLTTVFFVWREPLPTWMKKECLESSYVTEVIQYRTLHRGSGLR